MFEGSIVATVTPFRNGRVDAGALRKLVDFQIRSGTDGIVPCGTTGESATLSYAEHERVVDIVVSAARGRVPVIAGTGSNNTQEAIMLTRYARKAGADGALVITPYYNKPTQEGLYRHFRAVAEAADIPMILYNVPSRTGVNMTAETVARLSRVKTIVGVKEASGNLAQVCDILRSVPPGFRVLSGDDGLFFPMLALGVHGVISVAANVVPRPMADLYDAFTAGDVARARAIHLRLWDLFKVLFIETNPVPVKTALAMMKRIGGEIRLPLCGLSEASRKSLAGVLAGLDLV
jgi:4-hydroxy-tetrahydrodipicolinate synthase